MQSATICKWLLDAKGISVQGEWLEACIEWILNEEGRAIAQHRLQEMVYEQWLHADLKDVVTSGCIPEVVTQQQRGQIDGKFIIQVESIVDVGKPAYGQLQNLKGQSLDSVEGQDKKFSEPKLTRLLLMSISDGVQELQAMEYQPIPPLSAELLPGTKIVVQGAIPFHLGMLLLSASHIQVLGGRVEHLVEVNQPKKVLARILNRDELASDGQNTQSVTTMPDGGPPLTHQQTATVGSGTNLSNDCTRSSSQSFSKGLSTTVGRVSVSTAGEPSVDTLSTHIDANDYGGDIDMNDFEDFLNDAEEEEAKEVLHDLQVDHMIVGDDDNESQHDERSNENRYHDIVSSPVTAKGNNKYQTLHSTHTRPVTATQSLRHRLREEDLKHGDSRLLSQQFETKSKLSLKQKSLKTRTCKVSKPSSSTNAPVASIKPFQHHAETGEESSYYAALSEQSECPVSLESFSELTVTSWKLCPLVKVKAHFVKVCQKLSHDSGEWMTTVVICDDYGTELQVHICNQILEPLIGFSAIEFRDHINPNKANLKVRAKASRGFAYCQSAIASLNCFMVLEKRTMSTLPFVVRLLDS